VKVESQQEEALIICADGEETAVVAGHRLSPRQLFVNGIDFCVVDD